MKVIFGLGNPGYKYRNNRHNVGYMVVEELARNRGVCMIRSLKLRATKGLTKIDKIEVATIKPYTFMNNSGVCVKKVLESFGVSFQDTLVVYDDFALPLGIIRFRKKGSCGGHRGMASIIESLGSQEINRLRVGIGNQGCLDPIDYVLSDFSLSEKAILGEVISRSVAACIDWINLGASLVMQNYSRRKE